MGGNVWFHYKKYGKLNAYYIDNKISVSYDDRVFAYVTNNNVTKVIIALAHTDLMPYECDFNRFDEISIRQDVFGTSFTYSILHSGRNKKLKIPEKLSLEKIYEIIPTLE